MSGCHVIIFFWTMNIQLNVLSRPVLLYIYKKWAKQAESSRHLHPNSSTQTPDIKTHPSHQMPNLHCPSETIYKSFFVSKSNRTPTYSSDKSNRMQTWVLCSQWMSPPLVAPELMSFVVDDNFSYQFFSNGGRRHRVAEPQASRW